MSWARTMAARTAASSPPMLLGEEPELGAVEVPPEQLDRPGLRGGMQQEQQRRQQPVRCVLSPVHHDPGEVVRQVRPPAPEQLPHVEGALDHLGEEPLLGAEVAVDQGGGHPRVRGDLAGPGALVALGGEAAGGRLEDGLPGRGGVPLPLRFGTGSPLLQFTSGSTLRHVQAPFGVCSPSPSKRAVDFESQPPYDEVNGG